MIIKKEFKIGIFVLLVIVAVIFVINFLRGTDILGKEISVVGRYDNIETLVASAPVQIRGYSAGRVEKVDYDPASDKFIVKCSVDKRFRIPADSRMVIYSTSIMGGKAIRIDMGQSENFVSDGDELTTASDSDLMSALGNEAGPLMQKVSLLLDSLSVVVNNVNDVLNDENKQNIAESLNRLKKTMAEANALVASVSSKSGEIESVIENLNLLTSELPSLVDSVHITVTNLNSISSKINSSDLSGIMENIDTTIVNANDAIVKLKGPLTSILNDADSLVNAIKTNPKKYIKITVF